MRFLFGSHDAQHKEEYSLRELLPDRFGPLDLLEEGSHPLLMQPQDNRVRLHPSALQRVEARRGDAAFQHAAAAALGAAQKVRVWGGDCVCCVREFL